MTPAANSDAFRHHKQMDNGNLVDTIKRTKDNVDLGQVGGGGKKNGKGGGRSTK